MGVYADGNIYGVGWTIYDVSQNAIRREEYPHKNIQEIKASYDKLTSMEKYNAAIQFYAKCKSGHELSKGTFMCWIPGDVKLLESLFLGEDVKVPRQF